MSVYLFISGYPSCCWYATSFATTSFSIHFLYSCPIFTFYYTTSKSMWFRVSYVCKLSNFEDAKLGWYFFGFNDHLPPTLMKHCFTIKPPTHMVFELHLKTKSWTGMNCYNCSWQGKTVQVTGAKFARGQMLVLRVQCLWCYMKNDNRFSHKQTSAVNGFWNRNWGVPHEKDTFILWLIINRVFCI